MHIISCFRNSPFLFFKHVHTHMLPAHLMTAALLQSSSMVCWQYVVQSLHTFLIPPSISLSISLSLSLSLPHPSHEHTLTYTSHTYTYTCTHTERVLGIKIRTFGFKGHFKKRSVIIMNHVSHFDWLFFWSVVDRYGDFSFWKVITKEKPLRQLPVLGKYIVFQSACSLHFVHTGYNMTISVCVQSSFQCSFKELNHRQF